MCVFETTDIRCATYLKAKQVKLLNIRPLDQFRSTFVFEKSSDIDNLLSTFATGEASENVLAIISCYRHLVHDAKNLQNALANEVPNVSK